ncbi:uncharacterized protein LOC129595424 [Paramacrobiotus metropolitanus]|uniref:uncharacterized protein LOC129595424 n=1 Tax=Paramacrobiotus metropolitanus TaxID=2943436 RepID=UPI00244577A0|nr:uncharacterized protein LOC129595424 [Paramacrobiotus metropolitanus]
MRKNNSVFYKLLVVVFALLFIVLSAIWTTVILDPIAHKITYDIVRRSLLELADIPVNINNTLDLMRNITLKLRKLDLSDSPSLASNQASVVLGLFSFFPLVSGLFGVQMVFILITLPVHAGLSTINQKLEHIFQDFVSTSEGLNEKFFQEFRRLSSEHLNLAVRIQELDDIFGPALLWLFVSDMYVIVSGIGVMKGNTNGLGPFTAEFYTPENFFRIACLGSCLLAVRVWCAVRVHEEANIFGVRAAVLMEQKGVADNCSQKMIHHLQLIINRLGVLKNAFTLYQMCPLNKEFIATVIGVLLTYVTLIWEMDKQ